MSKAHFTGFEGDVQVVDGDTILVTYYNAPTDNNLRRMYKDLPARLRAERVNPRIPWLCGFKLDFCFRWASPSHSRHKVTARLYDFGGFEHWGDFAGRPAANLSGQAASI